MSLSASVVRVPPDSVPSSPVEKGPLPQSSSLHDLPTLVHLLSSPSLKSESSPDASPNVAATVIRASRRDQDVNNSLDLGSSSSSADIAELMLSLGFSCPNSAHKDHPHELEEGEIYEDANCSSSVMSSFGDATTVRPQPAPATPIAAVATTEARSPAPRFQREREQSQFGGVIPSSPEVVPSAPAQTLQTPESQSGNITPTAVPPTPVELPTLPSIATCSSLSTLSSSMSFQTTSTSATSISSSGSVKDSLLATADAIPASTRIHNIPESGTINLEELMKPIIVSALNPNATEHIPTSLTTPAISGSSFLEEVVEIATSASAPAISETTSDEHKTPNVYINGLPPHFPEDQLFELAAPFGEVRSVRSFTRHVGEKRSGYGFVLFESVESAEKCIQSLRKSRNLHPTFSKQEHKIPGLPYTQTGPSWEQDPTVTGSGSRHRAAGAGGGSYGSNSGESFKSKMEKFHDPNSTNLYIEGLPLSIDKASLAALVSPHRIKSQRFFQTRLSNPPRIIAFVRLETRAGAEEIIERLHGRMVRGWNDPGSRISVRFADTSEQRELRRTERAVREDDSSPARLTIAQAALLNLRGRDQLRSSSGYSAPVIGSGLTNITAPTANQVYHDFSSNAHDGVAGGYRGSAHDISNAAVALVNANNVAAAMSTRIPNQRYKTHQYDQGFGGMNDRRTMTPQMATLLDSLRNQGQPWAGSDDCHGLNADYIPPISSRNSHPLSDVDINLGYPTGHMPPQRQGGGVAQARSGYTATEEYILQTHQMNVNQRRRAQGQAHHQNNGGQADFNIGVRGYRTQASALSLPQSHGSYYSTGPPLPAVLEDEFHAGQAITPQGLGGRNRDVSSTGQSQSSLPHTSTVPSTQTQAPTRNYNNNNNAGNHNNQAHVRSTTLPPSTTSSSSTLSSTNQSRHYQHNSMSIPKSRNVAADIMRTTSQQTQTSSQPSLSSTKHRSTNSISSSITNDNNINNSSLSNSTFTGHHHHHHGYDKPSNLNLNSNSDYNKKSNAGTGSGFDGSHAHTVYSSSVHPFRGDNIYDVPQSSPPLVSPALTYSSRGSAATLSPSTPYVGSFPSSGGGLQGQVEVEVNNE